MPTPREQAGMAEASRLLQEGLQLLDQRTREVDALVDDAGNRAREIVAGAEARAQEITASAEQRRAELSEQIAALQSEVAAIREEMARMKSSRGRSGNRVGPVVEPAPAVEAAPLVVEEAPPAPAIVEPDAAQRWGRPSSPQAVRRAGRPRWLPRWLPFLVLLLPVGVVLAQLSTAGDDGSAQLTDAQTQSAAQLFTPPTEVPTTTLAPPVAPTQPPTRAPTATSAVTLVAASVTVGPTATSAPTSLPQAPAIALPGASPDGAVVAAYTTYTTYVVRDGDTLNRVASQFGVSGEAVMRASGLSDPNLLRPGQVLTIPRESGWLYRVQPGETLEQIASRFGTSPEDLVQAGMLPSTTVHPGDLLFIPNRLLSMK